MKFQINVFLLLTIPLLSLAASDFENSILDDEYIVDKDFIEAEILEVAPDVRTVTVRGTDRNKVREFQVPKDTIITIDGEDAKLSHLRESDIVLLAIDPRVDKITITRIKVPDTNIGLDQRAENSYEIEIESKPEKKSFSPFHTIGALAILMVAVIGIGYFFRTNR